MSDQNFNPFLVQDTDESLKQKVGGIFGLNAAANVTEVVFSDKAKDGSDSNSVTITVQIGDRQYKIFLFFNPGEQVYVKGELVGPEAEGYMEVYGASLVQRIAVIKHTLKAVGATQAQIDHIAGQIDPSDLAKGVQALLTALPANYKTTPVDVFLNWQYSIRKDQKETYLELPNSMLTGAFLIPAVKPVGVWKEVITDENDLSYVDNAGTTHPFKRSSTFMESPRASRQTEADNTAKASTGFNASAANPQNANKAKWG